MTESIAGRSYKYLTAVAPTRISGKDGKYVWLCACLCGNIRFVERSSLRRECVTCCGAGCPFYACEELLWGRTYERLTVLHQTPQIRNKHRQWRCLCVCGKKVWATHYDLEKGRVKSCGCLAAQQGGEHLREMHRRNREQKYERVA